MIPTLSSGGAERQLVNLVSSTDKTSIEHVVCAISDSTFFSEDVLRSGSKLIDLNVVGKHPFFSVAYRLRKIVSAEKPDLIHTWLYDANIATRLLRFLNVRTKMVTSLQLPDYEPQAVAMAGWNETKVGILKKIDQFTSRFAQNHFVACSEFVKKSYLEHFGVQANRMSVIPNSFYRANIEAPAGSVEALRKELNLSDRSIVFLNVARLDPQKNQSTLLKAFKNVVDDLNEAVLLIAGTGSLESSLKSEAAELGLRESVLFLGRRSDVGTLLDAADIFVFPSYFEGLPVALVEAMSKGLPCIASDIAVFREIIDHNVHGRLVDPMSVDAWSREMKQLARDSEKRSSLGLMAKSRANDSFSMEAASQQWERLYFHIAKNSVNR